MYLDKIIHSHRSAAAHEQRNLDDLVEQVSSLPQTRGFERHLRQASTQHLAVIAEIKRKSPSKGMIHEFVSVEQTSISYMQGGASALSILTDTEFFGGKNDDLTTARKFNYCPILRKDFTLKPFTFSREICREIHRIHRKTLKTVEMCRKLQKSWAITEIVDFFNFYLTQ